MMRGKIEPTNKTSKVSNAPNAPLELDVELTESTATLTFRNITYNTGINPDIDECNENEWVAKKHDLARIQRKTHPNIPAENFVRSFQDVKEDKAFTNKFYYDQFDSAFGSMVHTAFGRHQAIEIKPDDIHMLVLQGLARFFQHFQEDFRQFGVSFQGKKKIKINIPDIDNNEYWNRVPYGFANIIRELISVPETADVILQNYSNSTQVDKAVKAITLMGMFSTYFDYTLETMCFIPKFILQGTVEDWNKLNSIPEKIITQLRLKEYISAEKANGPQILYRWLNRLQPILNAMYMGRTGRVDVEFWQSFYKFKSHSGGNTVTGNIVYFYPFLKRAQKKSQVVEYRINEYILGNEITLGHKSSGKLLGPKTDELPVNFVEVDFKLEEIRKDEIRHYDMGMKGGIVAFQQEAGKKLSAHMDYSIFYKKRKPKIMKLSQNGSHEIDSEWMQQSKKNTIDSNKSKAITLSNSNGLDTNPKTETNLSSSFKIGQRKTIKFELEFEDEENKVPGISHR
ncbi:DUF4419 domain-containing protein [Legionella sainthelensi]|uniref:Uncharacterized protein n=1 Tax=Legionella sainthelensi TaxID=28087 RepID=A0A2H5FM47_9GAMM|nr:DUF4419 domain-containing protein [Legionella sainthelensi]AUH72625.1 DUF4419 domain-containing protein [Legionella sainthelensi]